MLLLSKTLKLMIFKQLFFFQDHLMLLYKQLEAYLTSLVFLIEVRPLYHNQDKNKLKMLQKSETFVRITTKGHKLGIIPSNGEMNNTEELQITIFFSWIVEINNRIEIALNLLIQKYRIYFQETSNATTFPSIPLVTFHKLSPIKIISRQAKLNPPNQKTLLLFHSIQNCKGSASFELKLLH